MGGTIMGEDPLDDGEYLVEIDGISGQISYKRQNLSKINQMASDAPESSAKKLGTMLASHPKILQFSTKEAYTQNDLKMKTKMKTKMNENRKRLNDLKMKMKMIMIILLTLTNSHSVYCEY